MRRWVKKHQLQRVLVHTVGNETIDGLLLGEEPGAIILVQSSFVDSSDSAGPVPMAGEVYVPRGRVAFIQKP